MSNLGKYFAEAGKEITELENDDCIIVGKFVDGKFVQKYILKANIIPQPIGQTASPTFNNLNITTEVSAQSIVAEVATIQTLELGDGANVDSGVVTPNKRMELKINGVVYYIAMEEK